MSARKSSNVTGGRTTGLQRPAFERDRERDADLITAGWIVVRFTYRAITVRAKETADRIAAAVARWS